MTTETIDRAEVFSRPAARFDGDGNIEVRASAALGCRRALWYAATGYEPTNPPSDDSLTAMEAGNALEPVVARAMERAGWKVDAADPQDPVTVAVRVGPNTVVTGHPDGTVRMPLPEDETPPQMFLFDDEPQAPAYGDEMVVEIKTRGPDAFKRWRTLGAERSHPTSVAQAAFYTLGEFGDLRDAVVATMDTGNRTWDWERIPADRLEKSLQDACAWLGELAAHHVQNGPDPDALPDRERRNGRMRWFGRRRGRDGGNRQGRDHRPETLQSRSRRPRKGFLAFAVLAVLALAVVTVPQIALADGHDEDERWRDEIDFELAEPVEGRRIFVEGLTVSGDRAAVTLRAATALDIRVRAFGGPEGTWLRFWGSASLDEGERIDYSLPLHGPVPTFTVSWEDTLGQAGALTFEEAQLPFPLPVVEGELCDLRMTSLGWTPGAVSGVVESECVTRIEHPVELQMVAGHESVTETALMDGEVTAITGTVSAATGTSHESVPFVPNGETRFRLGVPAGEAIHAVSVDVSLEASLRIPIPPLTQLTHHPERVEQVTRTVHLHRPGDSDYDSETVTVTCDDGAESSAATTSSATATAYAYVPSATIAREVTVDVLHKEHVKAETVEREPVTRTREESLSLAAAVGSDDPFQDLVLPEPEPEDPPAEQTPAGGGLSDWFDRLGWEWPPSQAEGRLW